MKKNLGNGTQTTPAKRIQVVSVRLVRESNSILYPARIICKPEHAVQLFRQFLGEEPDREYFIIIGLDTKNHPIMLNTVSIGTLNAALITPREVYKAAFLANCASLIACHNHPSGDPTPSGEDIEMTERLRDCGILLGLELLDSLIVGNGSFISLKEKGLM